MRKNSSILVATMLFVGLSVATLPLVPALAQDKVVATVNGKAITEADMALAEKEIGPSLDRLPPQYRSPDLRRRMVIEFLIENQLIAEAGRQGNLVKDTEYTDRMTYWRRRAMRDAYFEREIRTKISEAEARAFYDAQAKRHKGGEQIRASHILVKTEDKAKEIFELIAHDGDFAELAKKHSTGPSGPRGGDLGYFGRGQMVPAFEKAVFALKVGDVSLPVKTRFGWHLIKLIDRREDKYPPFAELKDRIILSLARDKAKALTKKLRDGAKVEYTDKSLAAQQ